MTYLIDTSGLIEIANSRSGNERAFLFGLIERNEIRVYGQVWSEFESACPDEAAEIKAIMKSKLRRKSQYTDRAANLTETYNHGLLPSLHDSNADLYTAAVASEENLIVLTDSRTKQYYQRMNIENISVEELLNTPAEINGAVI
ncbi:hypothetical protein [Acidiphilium sp.]|uniref:hypothetical protein n=1 Tax=Acidiphilium sp. TaxID=527 RepID=UPI00258881FE|nr:hypothetical protein [Acidiphilium sp.]